MSPTPIPTHDKDRPSWLRKVWRDRAQKIIRLVISSSRRR